MKATNNPPTARPRSSQRTLSRHRGRHPVLLAGCLLTAVLAHAAEGRLNGFDVANALIPVEAIRRGGPPRDGIPAIDRPRFQPASQPAPWMEDDDLLLSVTVGDETRGYPLRILVWHEIVNDTIAGRPIAVTYCPLCGTGMVFDRRAGGRELSFGVSGLLYQSDVLMYDRQTESLWSQLAMKSVAGPLAGTPLNWLPAEHVTWKAWRQEHPDGRVLTTDTGFTRNYRATPYRRYFESPDTMFPVPEHRTELPKKAWVLGVLVEGRPQCYPLALLEKKGRIEDRVGDVAIEVRFEPDTRRARVTRLADGQPLPSVMAYWFAWQAFHPETGLWKETE
ncbi:MAG: DUF3179 domain-containing protein [Verrucomicrobia bacterium]|nr:MAG: DUF3179 domain-containing protein [Verrucomicrobiota bacterium]